MYANVAMVKNFKRKAPYTLFNNPIEGGNGRNEIVRPSRSGPRCGTGSGPRQGSTPARRRDNISPNIDQILYHIRNTLSLYLNS